MEAKDLMIGDWVKIHCFNDNNFIIGQILAIYNEIVYLKSTLGHHLSNLKDVGPVPLTPEILEKNGWVYNDEDEKFFPETWVGGGLKLQGESDCGYRIVVTSDYDDEDTNNTPFVILYVHELQHALRLRKIKKEIIL